MSSGGKPHLKSAEKKVIYELGGDLGDGPRPFADLGRRVGLSEEEVLEIVRDLDRRGFLRRFGATLRHQRSGFTANAMVAWEVDPDHVDEIGDRFAALSEVSHCYRRRTAPGWTKNLYTMIHAAAEQDILDLAARMSQTDGVKDYEILFSHQELKKTSMRYFG